jgi:oligopeptide/dipeptide ABC transporter ATP-binding protein
MSAAREPILVATDLELEYTTREGRVRSLDQASLAVGAGTITALVGESGSGKSTLGLAAGKLLAANAEHVGGDLLVAGTPVLTADAETLRRLRREALGFVFQNPVAALDPTMRVERQMALVGEGERGAAEALEEVGLRDIPRVLRSYPHELSGGMAARVGIAMALLRRPRLLVADEPTAAVDATLREQILELLVTRCRSRDCALLLLTHDLHAVAHHCSHIAVMYAGRVVEDGPTERVLESPMHPYTRALLSALPGEEQPGERLHSIRGVPPILRGPSPGCAFAARCPHVMDHCPHVRPLHAAVEDRRAVCCHLFTGETVERQGEHARASHPQIAQACGTDGR